MDDETCDCSAHGVQPIALVCAHITATLRGETIGFVSYAPESSDDLRDAWCDDCDHYLQSHGGDWVEDIVEVPGGSSIVCAGCYREREADAQLAGRRVVYGLI